jgi:hypothetical protein
VKAAYPNRPVIWVTDSAAYHKVTRLGLANPSAPGVRPVTRSDISAACKTLGMVEEGLTATVMMNWAREAWHTAPVCPDLAYKEDVWLLYQPPYSSRFNAIERVWAWVKNKIAADFPPATRTFTELGDILTKELANVTFSRDQDGRIVPPARQVDVQGLYKRTLDIYKTSREIIEEWMVPEYRKQRLHDVDVRGDNNEPSRKASQAATESFPSPQVTRTHSSSTGTPLTEAAALQRFVRDGRGSVRSTEAGGVEQRLGSPPPAPDFDQTEE